MLKNTSAGYGWVAIFFHWVSAVVVLGLFGLGFYMVDLSYYDEMYRTAPFIHKSVGVLLMLFVVSRLIWKVVNPKVAALANHQPWEIRLAHVVHHLLYLLIFIAMFSGYFISTADGKSIEVFGWFEVPALISTIDNLEDIAGEIHEITTWIIMGLVLLHVAGALKHHFIDKDGTLKRMLGR